MAPSSQFILGIAWLLLSRWSLIIVNTFDHTENFILIDISAHQTTKKKISSACVWYHAKSHFKFYIMWSPMQLHSGPTKQKNKKYWLHRLATQVKIFSYDVIRSEHWSQHFFLNKMGSVVLWFCLGFLEPNCLGSNPQCLWFNFSAAHFLKL